MSALIALFNTENDALVESVFVDSCTDLVNCLDDEGIEKINEYVTLLSNKQTKDTLEQEISEALVVVMEHNAALYGTFLYESVEEEIAPENAKSLLENIRTSFGREMVMEVLSDKAKSRLKTAGKVGLGAAAVGGAGALLYNKMKGNDDVRSHGPGTGSGQTNVELASEKKAKSNKLWATDPVAAAKKNLKNIADKTGFTKVSKNYDNEIANKNVYKDAGA